MPMNKLIIEKLGTGLKDFLENVSNMHCDGTYSNPPDENGKSPTCIEAGSPHPCPACRAHLILDDLKDDFAKLEAAQSQDEA